MLLTLRMVAEVVVIVLTTKLKEKEIIFGLIRNFLCNFFCLFFFTITYLVLLYLRDILLLTEKGLWSLNLPGAN